MRLAQGIRRSCGYCKFKFLIFHLPDCGNLNLFNHHTYPNLEKARSNVLSCRHFFFSDLNGNTNFKINMAVFQVSNI